MLSLRAPNAVRAFRRERRRLARERARKLTLLGFWRAVPDSCSIDEAISSSVAACSLGTMRKVLRAGGDLARRTADTLGAGSDLLHDVDQRLVHLAHAVHFRPD
jgi:hypothetical protein